DGTFRRAAFLPDTTTLAVATINYSFSGASKHGNFYSLPYKRDVRLYDAKSGKPIRDFSAIVDSDSEIPRFLAFSPHGKKLIFNARNDTPIIWERATGKQSPRPDRHNDAVDWLRFSPDGSSLDSGSDGAWFYPEVMISWDLATGKSLQYSQAAKREFTT